MYPRTRYLWRSLFQAYSLSKLSLKCIFYRLILVALLKEIEGKPKISYVTVFERPGLHEFLSQAAEFAELILFTAGLEGMALIYQYLLQLFSCYSICHTWSLADVQVMLNHWLTE